MELNNQYGKISIRNNQIFINMKMSAQTTYRTLEYLIKKAFESEFNEVFFDVSVEIVDRNGRAKEGSHKCIVSIDDFLGGTQRRVDTELRIYDRQGSIVVKSRRPTGRQFHRYSGGIMSTVGYGTYDFLGTQMVSQSYGAVRVTS